MPINKKHYHPDWKDIIRPRILKRDQHRCKICKVPNKIYVVRDSHDNWLKADDLIKSEAKVTGQKVTKIILTVAHLNHIVTDNRDENLAALCQLHHTRHDREHKARMQEVSKVWCPELAITLSKKPDGHLYLNHLFVLTRARRNQIAQLLQIREQRSKHGGHSRYDQDLKILLAKSQIEYKKLVKRVCEILCEAYGIENGSEFLSDYWSSDTKIIGGSKLGLTVPSV